jgi:hypothetical protein
VPTRRYRLSGVAHICSGRPSPGPPREIAQTSFGDCLREGDPNDSASAWAFTDAIQGVGGSFTPSRNLRGSYKYRLLDSIRHPADRTHQATAQATASATAQAATKHRLQHGPAGSPTIWPGGGDASREPLPHAGGLSASAHAQDTPLPARGLSGRRPRGAFLVAGVAYARLTVGPGSETSPPPSDHSQSAKDVLRQPQAEIGGDTSAARTSGLGRRSRPD